MELYLISGALRSSDSSLWSTDTKSAPTKSFSAEAAEQRIQRRYEPQRHQSFILHNHVLAGCHGDQVLDSSPLDDGPHDFLKETKERPQNIELPSVTSSQLLQDTTVCTLGEPGARPQRPSACDSDLGLAVSDEGRQQPVGLAHHPCVVFGFTPLHQPLHQLPIGSQLVCSFS
ncbi:hypothetical protein EYF80_043156 [Liparis tanakae]|uniref:Uncharacterized protein n=1 Tax=Liparis tanakae TaxID=230148 RepID=A0A4Z2G145_9TELE|nr:hypothetical protein EYF80_043156 [Liparis tanakae]